MPGDLGFFLLLAAGFWFLRFFRLTHFISQTWEGTRLVFWAGIIAAFLGIFARLLTVLLRAIPVVGPWLERGVHAVAPLPYAGTVALGFLVGVTLPFALNWLVFSGSLSTQLASRISGNDLYQLLFNAAKKKLEVCVSMEDRKVYVGAVMETPKLTPREAFFRLLPTFSGYRDKDTLELKRTTDYRPLLREVAAGVSTYTEEELAVVLPFQKVVSARVFDDDIFNRLFSQEGSAPTSGPAASPPN